MKRLLNRRILVVDDEPILREIFKDELEIEGAHVVESSGATEAVLQVSKQKFDTVISDVRMPDGDGIQLLEQCKKIDVHLPVFLITGFSDLSVDEAYAKGVDGIFPKPFEINELIDQILDCTLAREERLTKNKNISAEVKLQKKFFDANQAIQNGQLQIGRGGFFIASHGEQNIYGTIDFQIDFSQGSSWQGQGVVRWSRKEDTKELKAGFGIEYTFLSNESAQFIFNYLDQHQPTHFIPLGRK